MPTESDRAAAVPRALLVGLVVGCVSWIVHPAFGTDFDPLWAASRAFLAGQDPYDLVGPGRAIPWPFPLYYPATALVVLAPLVWMPMAVASAVFVGLTAGALAWTFERDGRPLLPVFLSASSFFTLYHAQWSFLLCAAALVPRAFGAVFAAKPPVGTAAFAYRPDWRALGVPVFVLALSLAIAPQWPRRWLVAASGGVHPAAVMVIGGAALLLAALRWRRPEGRLLSALALVPQTWALHETLILFLVPRSARASWLLCALSWLAVPAGVWARQLFIGDVSGLTGVESIRALTAARAPAYLLLLHLPCLVMVLCRHADRAEPAE